MANTFQDQVAQLTLKFQLAYFVVSKSKPFKLYADFAEFECDVHNVKIGSGYLNISSCIEIISSFSKSKVQTEISELINERTAKFYSIHNDGSSAAKTWLRGSYFL